MYWEDILTDVLFVTVGLILFLGGIILRTYVDRNRFYRRGPGGLQQFPSYSKAVFTTLHERFLMFISLPAIVFGFVILFYWYMIVRHEDSQRKEEERKKNEKIKSDANAHFLVPADEDRE